MGERAPLRLASQEKGVRHPAQSWYKLTAQSWYKLTAQSWYKLKSLLSQPSRGSFVESSPGEASEVHEELIQATVKSGGKITLDGMERSPELEQLGYGEREGKHHTLKDHEALYLIFTKKLNLRDAKGNE